MRSGSLLRKIVALIGILFSSQVHSAIEDSGLLNDVTERFLTHSSTWGVVITTYATWLFWLLAIISMIWTFGMMALRRADIGEFFAEFVRFIVTTGFFWWLLSNGPVMAMAVINSLRKIGAEAGGLPSAISPSTPISIGFDIVKKAFSGLSWIHPIDNLGIVLVSAAVVLAMAVVAANVLIALVTAWVMAYAGVFILGFGGARWTSDMAIGYFKAMLGIGLELMTMTLLVAVAVSVIDGFYRGLDGTSIYELLLVLCVCVVLALLIDKIPARVAALAGGGSGAGMGAGSVMAAAGIASATLASGGAALLSAGASLAGGAQAIQSAISHALASEGSGGRAQSTGDGTSGVAASDSSSSGTGTFAAAMGDTAAKPSGGGERNTTSESAREVTSAGDGGGGFSSTGDAEDSTGDIGGNIESSSNVTNSGPKTTSASGFAAKAGRIAAGTAANLAHGVFTVAKAKSADMKDSAMERISQTVGGKVASVIKARANASNSSEAAQFGEDSLSAGSQKADAISEITAFRDSKRKTE